MELVDTGRSFMVSGKHASLSPFSRDKLFISIYKSCAHRRDAIADSSALTETIASKLLFGKNHQVILSPATIRQTVIEVLGHFDKPAVVHYQAYHETS
jgi:transcriptional regulator NrdR family protein